MSSLSNGEEKIFNCGLCYKKYSFSEPRYFSKYDFIIVGSGSGGCVLANRLTENPNWNVLLIEAGGIETSLQDVPIMAAFMQSTAYNWGYTSEPQSRSCLGK